MKRIAEIISLLLTGTFGLLICVSLFWGPLDYTRVPVEFEDGIYPTIRAEIDQQPVRLMLNTGYGFYMGLDPNVIETTGFHEALGNVEFTLINGKRKSRPKYRFRELKIGKRSFRYYPGHASETWAAEGEECDGDLGLQILERTNLLLNFPKKEIVFFHRVESLRRLGIKLEKMVRLPLLDFPLLMVECETDLGPRRAILHSECDVSRVNVASIDQLMELSELNGAEGWRSSRLAFGTHDFGPALFMGQEIAEVASSIDLILGLDFLLNHVVCIDYVNHCVYISPP